MISLKDWWVAPKNKRLSTKFIFFSCPPKIVNFFLQLKETRFEFSGIIYIIKEKHQSKEPSKYIHFKQNLSTSYWTTDWRRGLQSSLFWVEILSKYHSLHPFLNCFSIPFYNVLKYDLWKVRHIRIYKVCRICTRNLYITKSWSVAFNAATLTFRYINCHVILFLLFFYKI